MKNSFIVLIICFGFIFYGCSPKISRGTYTTVEENNHLYNNHIITLNKDNNYTYKKLGEGAHAFSSGKFITNKKKLFFNPDSSFFFHISAIDYYFDPALSHNERKIILTKEKDSLKNFFFSFYNGMNEIKFDDRSQIDYYPILPDHNDGSLVLKAQFRNKNIVTPPYLDDSLFSNKIIFFDVNANDPNDKPWNVLKLQVDINESMFNFTILPPYIFTKNTLVKETPVFKLKK